MRVSGQYAGAATRFLAFAIDAGLIALLFGLGLAALSFVLDLVSSVRLDLTEGSGLVWQIGCPSGRFSTTGSA